MAGDFELSKQTNTIVNPLPMSWASHTLLGMMMSYSVAFLCDLQLEYRLAVRAVRQYNFLEGVRAALVDKDKQPLWQPSSLQDLDESSVEALFEPLPCGPGLVL